MPFGCAQPRTPRAGLRSRRLYLRTSGRRLLVPQAERDAKAWVRAVCRRAVRLCTARAQAVAERHRPSSIDDDADQDQAPTAGPTVGQSNDGAVDAGVEVGVAVGHGDGTVVGICVHALAGDPP